MDQSKQPGIIFNGIILVAEEFSRTPSVPEDVKAHVHFAIQEIGKSERGHYCQLESTLTGLYEEQEVYKLKCVHIGFFQASEESPNMDIESYVGVGSATLMFPFIREHIACITQRAGIPTVLLPPTNVAALFSETGKE